jgi:hypothetical protein
MMPDSQAMRWKEMALGHSHMLLCICTATCKVNGNRSDGVLVVNWYKSAVENRLFCKSQYVKLLKISEHMLVCPHTCRKGLQTCNFESREDFCIEQHVIWYGTLLLWSVIKLTMPGCLSSCEEQVLMPLMMEILHVIQGRCWIGQLHLELQKST